MSTELSEGSDDTYLMQQYSDGLAEYKSELKGIQGEHLALGLEESDDLFGVCTRLSKKIFDCSHRVKRSLGECETRTTHENRGVRLPKLEVPAFDGNVRAQLDHILGAILDISAPHTIAH